MLRAFLALLLSFLRDLYGSESYRPGDRAISSRWLSRILSRDVKKCSMQSLKDEGGWVGLMYRLNVVFDDSSTTTLVLKTSKPSFQGRLFTISCGHEREAFFYNSSFSTSLQSMLPKVYYAYGSTLLGEYVLVMQDLSIECESVKFSFGNQVFGVSDEMKDLISGFPEPKFILYQCAKQCAEINLRFWNDCNVLSSPAVKGGDWYLGKGRMAWESAIGRAFQVWEKQKSSIQQREGLHISQDLVDIIDGSFALSNWKNFQIHIGENPFTLSHGDFHAGNMMRNRIPKFSTVFLVDWSEFGVGEPGSDLGQMLISDVSPHLMEKHGRSMIRQYWQCLIDGGVDIAAFPFEKCWDTFCRSGVERWIWLFCIIIEMDLPSVCVQYFHDQIMAFIKLFCPDQKYFLLKSVVTIP